MGSFHSTEQAAVSRVTPRRPRPVPGSHDQRWVATRARNTDENLADMRHGHRSECADVVIHLVQDKGVKIAKIAGNHDANDLSVSILRQLVSASQSREDKRHGAWLFALADNISADVLADGLSRQLLDHANFLRGGQNAGASLRAGFASRLGALAV